MEAESPCFHERIKDDGDGGDNKTYPGPERMAETKIPISARKIKSAKRYTWCEHGFSTTEETTA
jgi:hypothetical protein